MKTGWFGTVATFVFEHTTVTDPGDKISKLTEDAKAFCVAALGAINQNSFAAAAKALIDADTKAQISHRLMLTYKAGLEHSAGATVTVLEGVKTASEMTLVVGGAVVSGGATVAFVGGAGITAASDLAPALVGDKVDWGKFALDMALTVVLKKVGPGEAMEKAILERMGVDAIKKVGEKKSQRDRRQGGRWRIGSVGEKGH